MAGTSTRTDKTRRRLRAVMLKGLPQDTAQRPVFHFDVAPVYAKHDRSGKPWDYSEPVIPPVDEPRDDVLCGDGTDQIVCTMAVLGRDTGETSSPVGPLDREWLELTFLDVDYAKIAGFTTVTIGFSTFRYKKTLPHDGLNDLEVITVYVFSDDVI